MTSSIHLCQGTFPLYIHCPPRCQAELDIVPFCVGWQICDSPNNLLGPLHQYGYSQCYRAGMQKLCPDLDSPSNSSLFGVMSSFSSPANFEYFAFYSLIRKAIQMGYPDLESTPKGASNDV